nr:MAG TPA: hypothetical protein [Caudoviricetes sp.]DAN58706.1 MAG TPA: hypothetical protein [Caudoviricetes sp.]
MQNEEIYNTFLQNLKKNYPLRMLRILWVFLFLAFKSVKNIYVIPM